MEVLAWAIITLVGVGYPLVLFVTITRAKRVDAFVGEDLDLKEHQRAMAYKVRFV